MDSELLQRQEEGRVLKREDQLTDISLLPESVLTGQSNSNYQERVKLQDRTQEGVHAEASTMGSISMDSVGNTPRGDLLGSVGSLEHLGSDDEKGIKSAIHEVKQQIDARIDNLKQRSHNLGAKISDKAGELKEQAAQFNLKDSSQALYHKASEKGGELKEQLTQKARDVKEGAKELYQEASERYAEIKAEMEQKEKELAEQAKEAANKASEQTQQLQSQAAEKKDELTEKAQNISEQVSQKAGELKEQFNEKKEEMREKAQDLSNQASQKASELKEQAGQKKEEVREKAQDLSNQASQKASELKRQAGQKKEELRQDAQNLSQKVSQKSGEVKEQIRQESFNLSQESHQQHHLSADSQSFRPNEESHVLVEAVKEGLEDRSTNLAEKVNEADEQFKGHDEQIQSSAENTPAITKQWRQYLYQESAHEWNLSIKEGKFDIKNQTLIDQGSLKTGQKGGSRQWTDRWALRRTQPGKQRKNRNQQKSQGSQQQQQQKQPQSKPRQRRQRANQRRGQQRRYLYQESAHDWNQSIKAGRIDMTNKVQNQQKSQQGARTKSWTDRWSQRRDQPRKQRRNQNQQQSQNNQQNQRPRQRRQRPYQRRAQNRNQYEQEYQIVYVPKSNQQNQGSQQSQEQTQEENQPERVPLLDIVQQKYSNYRNKISNVIHIVKGDAASEIQETVQKAKDAGSSVKQEVQEKMGQASENISERIDNSGAQVQAEASNLRSKISGGIHSVTDKLSHLIHSNESKDLPQQEKFQTAQPEASLASQSLTDKIKGRLHGASNRMGERVDNLKSRFIGKEGEVQDPEFHKVTEGFSETVQEYRQEIREKELPEPLHSDNPFEALIGEKNLVQPLNDTEIVGGDVQELAQGIHEEDLTNAQTLEEDEQVKRGILGRVSDNISNLGSLLSEKIRHPFGGEQHNSQNKENTN